MQKRQRQSEKQKQKKISYFSVRMLRYWARRQFGEHERGVRVDFYCRVFFRAYTRKYNRRHVWKATRKLKS